MYSENLEITRRVRDNLHGSIDLTPIEDQVLAHPYFQRLRRIRQTAFLSYVFPGATHTRFEHSLGVLHLACVAWTRLKANQTKLKQSMSHIKNFDGQEEKVAAENEPGRLAPTFEKIEKIFGSDYTFQALRLAALMHDIGHPPFSHSGERLLPSYKDILEENDDLPEFLKVHFEGQIQKLKKNKKSISKTWVRHEIFTLLLLSKVITDLNKSAPEGQLKIDPQDVASIIHPAIPPAPNSEILKLNADSLCHEIISGEFDVDRMDYLLRDSREAGVIYGLFDSDRILDSLHLYEDSDDQKLHLAIKYSGLAAFEDYLRARQSMYLQLYFHKSSVAAEAMMQRLSRLANGIKLPAKIEAYSRVDEHNVINYIEKFAKGGYVHEESQSEFFQILENLILNRRLWKRVYEATGTNNSIRLSPEILTAKETINQLGFPHEQVSSSTSLTTFKPQYGSKRNVNTLKLIKKNNHQIPQVLPIDDFSQIYSSSQQNHITRLYVSSDNSRDGKSINKIVEKALNEAEL